MRLLSACVLGAFCAAVGRGCNPGDVDLVVTVVNAHVRSADVGHGKSDPFVRVTIGEHTHHTSTIENNNRPEWDEELHYACANTSQPILVTVWDKDPVVANDLLVSNDWYDWSTVPQGVDLKLFDTGEDEENSEYYVTVRVVWTMEENCPSTCYGDYTCDYWDTNFGWVPMTDAPVGMHQSLHSFTHAQGNSLALCCCWVLSFFSLANNNNNKQQTTGSWTASATRPALTCRCRRPLLWGRASATAARATSRTSAPRTSRCR